MPSIQVLFDQPELGANENKGYTGNTVFDGSVFLGPSIRTVLYRRGRIWWFEFEVAGRRYRETTRTSSQTLAAEIERKRHRDIETAISGIRPRTLPLLFPAAAKEYLAHKKPSWAPKTHIIETTNVAHLTPAFGRLAAHRHHRPPHQRLSADPHQPEGGPQNHQQRSRHAARDPPPSSAVGADCPGREAAAGPDRHRHRPHPGTGSGAS